METAIRWSPTSTLSEQRFLLVDVVGRSFKRCTVQRYFNKTLRYDIRSTYSQVQAFRAFDWAPHDETLVAVGQWSGEVTVLRIDDASPSVSLPAKHQRLCNAVAFSRAGLLAAGLERVRNDFCLNIWDINQRFASFSSSGSGAAKPFVEPYRKFASSEAISSIKFFAGQPEVLVTGVKGRGIRIYDLRENAGSPHYIFKPMPSSTLLLILSMRTTLHVLVVRETQQSRSGTVVQGHLTQQRVSDQAQKPVVRLKGL